MISNNAIFYLLILIKSYQLIILIDRENIKQKSKNDIDKDYIHNYPPDTCIMSKCNLVARFRSEIRKC